MQHTPQTHSAHPSPRTQAGAVEVLAGFEAAADLRVADAARGCLLNLQQLGDAAATAAAGALTGDEADLSVEYDVFLSHKWVLGVGR